MAPLPRGFFTTLIRLMATRGALGVGTYMVILGYLGRIMTELDTAYLVPISVAIGGLSILSIFLYWWAPRQMAGELRGRGRFFAWLLVNIGSVIALVAIVILTALAFSGGDLAVLELASEDPTWVPIGALFCGVLIFPFVWATALAISGNRLSLAEIYAGLRPYSLGLMVLYSLSLFVSFHGVTLDPVIQQLSGAAPLLITAIVPSLVEGLASMSGVALMVAAYLIVDRTTQEAEIAETFG